MSFNEEAMTSPTAARLKIVCRIAAGDQFCRVPNDEPLEPRILGFSIQEAGRGGQQRGGEHAGGGNRQATWPFSRVKDLAMPFNLQGPCGKVRFSADSYAPVPFMRCYCSICRKTAGGGGCTINLHADKRTL